MNQREELTNGFLIIPKEILTVTVVATKPFSFAEKCIYSYLLNWSKSADKVFPSTRKLCLDLGIGSRNSLSKYMKKLEEKGLVTVLRSKGKSSVYTVLPLNNSKKPCEKSIVKGTNQEKKVEVTPISPVPVVIPTAPYNKCVSEGCEQEAVSSEGECIDCGEIPF